jgi:hypothetical protein
VQSPWSGRQSPLELTTFSHLKDNLNNENCTLFSIIYAANNVTICAETLLIEKKLMTGMSLSFVNNFANTYAVKVFL